MMAFGRRSPARRERAVRRAVVFLPNGFTLFNLWCGIFAIVLASRLEFSSASLWVVIGGVADALDGRVARATGTGSRFGEELDSLVDAISFGLAPALIMYFAVLNRGTWMWLFVAFYASCAVMRLARFNVEQAGRQKTHFHGLPSPAAGLTLASYYWFSQTSLYNDTVILFTDSKTLSDLPWHAILPALMAVLGALMISDVPYPAVPSIGFRSLRRVFGTLVIVGCIGLIFVRREFIFPALVAYVLYGAAKWVGLGLLGRAGSPDQIFWEEETNGDAHLMTAEYGQQSSSTASNAEWRDRSSATSAATGDGSSGGHLARRRRRRGRGRSGQPNRPPGNPSAPPASSPPPSSRPPE
jgi:CDP-diacylglycerol---serine O-phosphatidyltransferase